MRILPLGAGRRAEGLEVAQEAVTLYRELVGLNRDAYLPNLATSVNNLATQLAGVGRRAEGLEAAQEAVTLYRELSEHMPEMYGPAAERAYLLLSLLSLLSEAADGRPT